MRQRGEAEKSIN